MRILVLGDVFGSTGMNAVIKELPIIKKKKIQILL